MPLERFPGRPPLGSAPLGGLPLEGLQKRPLMLCDLASKCGLNKGDLAVGVHCLVCCATTRQDSFTTLSGEACSLGLYDYCLVI